MTDDLVKTLRTPNGILDWQYRIKCADRIEALEAALISEDADIADRALIARYKVLEAALREMIIVQEDGGGTNAFETALRNARRALEGK